MRLRRGKRCKELTGACRGTGNKIRSAAQMQKPPIKVGSAEYVHADRRVKFSRPVASIRTLGANAFVHCSEKDAI